MTGLDSRTAAAMEGFARSAQEVGHSFGLAMLGAVRNFGLGLRSLREAYERRVAQRIEDEARRARLAAFEASDPAGRLEAMNREHRAVASRLAAEYGFPDPATISPERRRQLLNAEPRSWGLDAHEYFGYRYLVDNR